MEKNGTYNKYEFIDYYLLDNLDRKYKNRECKEKFFDKNNLFLSTKSKNGKFCQNVYNRELFKNNYDFIIVENNNPDKNISNIIDKVDPIIGILLPKSTKYDEAKIMQSIETINNSNQYNDVKRQLKSSLNNCHIQLLDEKGENYDKRYGIVSANNNFSNNNFQQQYYYNNNNINKSGYYYNQNNNNGMFNQNKLQNAGNLVVNNFNNFNNNNNYNNHYNNNYNNNNSYNYNYINQNNFNNINNNQAYNNFNQINNVINPKFVPNNINNLSNINQNQINNQNQNVSNNIINNNQINNQSQNGLNGNANQNQVQNNSANPIYLFPKVGLNNIGSTCYMNATLQCLLHVSELTVYFLREYPNDKNNLNEKNKLIESHGQISNVFYELVKGVCEDEYKIKKHLNLSKLKNSVNDNSNYSGSHKNFEKVEPDSINSNTVISRSFSFSPYNFKKTLGKYNPQFKKFEANDSKDLILYLMQTMHEELNYFGGNNSINLSRPNQYDKVNTFMYFMNSYNAQNFSIISNIFYGTYENATLCHECKKLLYNYQKFEFISFGMYDYQNKLFDIYNGFEDNSKPQQLRGENQFYCNNCKKLVDAEITSKIIQPPNKLLINIDYGKNKAFKPSQVKFGEIIDITKFICFDFSAPIKYKIMGVCTHLGYSGSYGHYIAYCKHRETGDWFNFNDSSCRKCNKDEIYGGSPYLLLYERT